MGKSKYGDITKEKLDNELDKNIGNENYSSELQDNGVSVTFIKSGRTYLVDYNGNVEKAVPRIAVDENSLTITNTDGSSITKGQVEQGTALKISFNASVKGGTVAINPSLPHTTTAEEIAAKSVTFTITASVPNETVEPLEYIVNLNDVYKSNVVSMEELKANASTYFGYDVINYAETLPSNLQDTEWQLFYAGALDGETEERIYLITKGFVKNTVLPSKNGATPIPTDDSDYKAKFSNSNSASKINDGVCNPSIYTGSSDVVLKMQKYNKDYFITKNYSSTNPNMRAVAYMLDTNTWSSFATSSKKFAEWAIGGPTVELLFTAYNKYKGNTGSNTYITEAKSENGYQVSNDNGSHYYNYINANTTKISGGPYSADYTIASAYWLASPGSFSTSYMLFMSSVGGVVNGNYNNTDFGFRPLVLLNSNFQLEKTTSGGKEVFKIVPKTE